MVETLSVTVVQRKMESVLPKKYNKNLYLNTSIFYSGVGQYIKSLKLQNENGNSMHSFIFVSHQTCRPQNVKVIHSRVIMSAKLQRV